MTADFTFLWLSAWIFMPLGGAGIVALVRSRSNSAAEALAQIVAWAVVGASALAFLRASGAGAVSGARTWIASLGVTAALGADGLSVSLGVVLALAVALCLHQREREPEARVRPELLLVVEGAALGLFLSRDMVLLLASYGVLSLAAASMSRRPAPILGVTFAGLVALTGLSAPVYRSVYEQTGFYSTELARWFELVLYPSDEATLFLWAVAATAVVFVGLPVAISETPRRAQGVSYASLGVAASYLLFRVAMPLSAGGASSFTSPGKVLALTIAAAVALFGSSKQWLFLGYQAMFVFGLLSLDASAVAGAELMLIGSAISLSALSFTDSRTMHALFAVLLTAISVVGIVVPAFAFGVPLGVSSFVAIVGLGYRLARPRPRERAETRPDATSWAVAPLLVCLVSLVVGFGSLRDGLLPSAETLLRHIARESER